MPPCEEISPVVYTSLVAKLYDSLEVEFPVKTKMNVFITIQSGAVMDHSIKLFSAAGLGNSSV
jgi:hypothetical protein